MEGGFCWVFRELSSTACPVILLLADIVFNAFSRISVLIFFFPNSSNYVLTFLNVVVVV